ncbi:MAG: HAMP domain-containing histidine kinase [Deltaproteobacteria bacterium]|nr:HAMP domain-containing histidine kinase [Deltaproteobacteria bacterium]MBI3387348.1 HAMP domain-containing histidine kinase [Deltaproteobacteria bacterium]
MTEVVSAGVRAEFEEQGRGLLVAQSRIGFWILLTFVVLFTVVDLVLNPGNFSASQMEQVSLLRGVQVVGIAIAFRALGRQRTRRGVACVSVFLASGFNATVVLACVMIHDTILAPTVLMSTTMFGAAFLAWGVWAQVLVGLASALGIIVNVVAVTHQAAGIFGYNQFEAFAALVASVWVAQSLERQRWSLFVSQKARDAAVAGQLEEARISDALARVGGEMIEAVDTPQLVERLCRVSAAVLDCDVTHAYLRDDAGQAFVPVAAYGTTREQWEMIRVLRIAKGDAARLEARFEREAVVELSTSDARASVGDALAVVMEQAEVTRSLFMALWRGSELTGTLHAGDRSGAAGFTLAQRRIAHGIAHLASMTMEHARVRAELERADQVKAHFVATLSHELRNPITAIQGYNYMLLRGASDPLSGDQADLVRRSEKCAQELSDLITATLDLSRFEAKRVPLDLQALQVSDLFDELRRELRAPAEKPDVQLRWLVHADPHALQTDPLKLKMVLRNLVTNALKFTERGAITVSATERDGGVEFRVEDTGIGIAADQVPTIFEPFTQAHGIESRRKGGVGLGLHLVRRLVDVLGGTIAVSSEVGRGSTFRIWVPSGAATASTASPDRRP